MKKIIILVVFIDIVNSLLGQNKLKNDIIFQDIFSSSELHDLQLLFDFFNQSIGLLT